MRGGFSLARPTEHRVTQWAKRELRCFVLEMLGVKHETVD
jgi:hypothetical protein